MDFKDKFARVVLKSGSGVEGFIYSYSPDELIIYYSDSDNISIIPNPYENVIMINVYQVERRGVQAERIVVEPEDEPLNRFEPDPRLRALSVAELKLEKNKAIKKMISSHLKTFTPTQVSRGKYDRPDFS